ncbi:hypothetical protein CH92_14605 [Stutzerimonas stutzeri]|uniref:Uncharacterized protein n=1 Tax=Stutzerimonas stutzeri TaxID=316 RepID=W8RCR5_STUST|nr:hypothetical protein [Stutzerimonas stutzeri]AHL76257.1 hypothetical protein CH92_14605 [Stutzerimonas stutzeri]MCQ4329484.1 nucleoside 2-deoxyribosyltransferase [Stutzerimonas stutzeri]
MSNKIGFFAYPAKPAELGHTIEAAVLQQNAKNSRTHIKTWTSLDIIGHFISQQVLAGIDEADFLVADITKLNFNVTYEIGYAIGRGKRILLTRNSSLKESNPTIKDVGIFDTIGYKMYQNSSELSTHLLEAETKDPLELPQRKNTSAPVYLLESRYKTDWASRIVSRIKKAKYIFRSFDPNEQPRLSASDAIKQVTESLGVVVPLLALNAEDSEIHNMRGAFLAGLADGQNIALCILQNGEDPVPLDYRDFAKATYHPDEVNDHIAEFASQVAEAFQQSASQSFSPPQSYLQKLDLGATSAENEMRTLQMYYLKTDQFLKSLRGEANVVVGRKGSGKSAIFLQIRDRERNKSNNIVLDLKPDGYKLIKFKELILDFLEEGTFQHTIMAFWEYILLLEICYKILEKDRERHIHDHNIYESYRKLADIYHSETYVTEGDFSERMSILMEKISTEYQSKYGTETKVRLSAPQLTQLLYSHDVRALSEQVIQYMRNKDTLWLLFDNIDKGWPTSGLQHEDMLIVRALLDATRKIERQFDRAHVNVNSIVFLRNDVYELLVKETSDRGKEAKVILDWTDPDLLRELLRLRIVANNGNTDEDFHIVWPRICTSHYNGEETSQYLIERSLMRPRFLLNLINQCKSFAINLNHEKINSDDIEKGLSAYSTDLLTDIGYEINDIANNGNDVLYAFIGSKSTLSREDIRQTLIEFGVTNDKIESIIELLLWYGFIGIETNMEAKYIYNFNYSMHLINGIIKKSKNPVYHINPAFWPSLMIDS